MKLVNPPRKPQKNAIIAVVRARHVSDYKLRIEFSDRVCRVVDFGPFLRASANPLIRVFLDPKKFAQFTVADGDLMWGDYELCFPVSDLHKGRI
jgi:hypothetical protein